MAKAKIEASKLNNDRILYAFLATFLSIIGFIIAILVKKDDDYVMHYAKQSLVIFIAGLAVGILSLVLKLIPILGGIISVLASLLVAVIWVISWIYSLSGEMKEVPVIGQFGEKIKIH